MLAKVDFYLL